MSYLDAPRITFSGGFQADVSTVNNDVRHYDSENFQPRYQEPGDRTKPRDQQPNNGWWNPEGTGTFRLFGVRVESAAAADGSRADDPAIGLFLNGQDERSAAKLVDLDPQFQMASEIWGLRVYLTDGKVEYLRGTFHPAPFRDIYFGRQAGVRGSASASAKFVSVLTDVELSAAASASPVLSALEQAAAGSGGRLSICLTTFGYDSGFGGSRFTFGTLLGAIGPWRQSTPETFVLGRRFAPANGSASGRGIGYFDGAVSHDGSRVAVDLGNAIPITSSGGAVRDVGDLELAVLAAPDSIGGDPITVRAGTAEGATVGAADYVPIGTVDYRDADWLKKTSGIASFELPSAARRIVGDHPLALIRRSGGAETVEIRETIEGLLVRADDFTRRIDTESSGPVPAGVRLYAGRYGAPLVGARLDARLGPPQAGNGLPPLDPPVPTPSTGTPPDAVRLLGLPPTGDDGRTRLSLAIGDPGNPRGYIDGQIYFLDYGLAVEGQSPLPRFEQIILHVRDAYDPRADPEWQRDVAPVMMQYGNLYPIMSRRLFSFADEATVRAHAQLLHFAFSRPLDDPTHMPATRDLSAGKRHMILTWLSGVLGIAPPPPPSSREVAAAALEAAAAPVAGYRAPKPSPAGTAALLDALGEDTDGKSAAARSLLQAEANHAED